MYGLHAIYELSFLSRSKPTQLKEISTKANIPQNYLEQLFALLKKANLLSSVRGAHGGYFLSKDPKDISVREIVSALEGDLTIIDTKVQNHALGLFYEESEQKLKKIFDLSLYDLQQYEEKMVDRFNYSI